MALGLLAVALGGCLSTLPPSPSGQTPSPLPGVDFTTACHPIDLRGPGGQEVDLTGAWTSAAGRVGFFGLWETTWIQQIDDCVWGAIVDDEFPTDRTDRSDGNLSTLHGHLSPNFVLEGDLILIVRNEPGLPGTRAPIRLLIEWQTNGQIRLSEDRDPNVAGPRCSFRGGGAVVCGDPVILYRVEDDPLAEFRLARDAACRPLWEQVDALLDLLNTADRAPEPSLEAALLDQIAAIGRVEAEQLSALTPPDDISAEFAADMDRREADLDLLEAMAQALRSGDEAEAARLDGLRNLLQQAMRQFEAAHRFAACPY